MYKEKILIVEDEMIVAKDMEYTIEGLGYFGCGTVCRWDETIKIIEDEQPTLVLMDVMLGEDLDGISLGMHIWENYRIPIIFVSAYTDKTTIKRAKRANPFGYLRKPFDEKELYLAIEMARYKFKKYKTEILSKDWIELTLGIIEKGLITIDCNNEIVYVNEKALLALCKDQKEIDGENVVDVFEFIDENNDLKKSFTSKMSLKGCKEKKFIDFDYKVITNRDKSGGVFILN